MTKLVSQSTAGDAAWNDSFRPSISGGGLLVAFESVAGNLVPGDSNLHEDVFVRDVRAGTTTRVSVSSAEEQANDSSIDPSLSADGRRVAFTSFATDLVLPDDKGFRDVLVRDRVAGTTVRASVAVGGGEANEDSFDPALSADGRYVAFTSLASNLVTGDTNGQNDVFVRDLAAGTTRRVSVSGSGAEGNDRSGGVAISGDGRLVSFNSVASNLVPGDTNDPSPGQPGGGLDIFVRDLMAGTTRRVSVRSGGGQAGEGSHDAVLSLDGRWVAFASSAADLVVPGEDTNNGGDVFLHELATRRTTLVSRSSSGAQGGGGGPALSADGRYVAFSSGATNLVPGDNNSQGDIFRHNRLTGRTVRLSITSTGGQANRDSSRPVLSADGASVAFQSDAVNLVQPPTDLGITNVFVRHPVGDVATPPGG